LEEKVVPAAVEMEPAQDGDLQEPSDGESLGSVPVDKDAQVFQCRQDAASSHFWKHVDMLASDYEEGFERGQAALGG
jgi:hypothetical protein